MNGTTRIAILMVVSGTLALIGCGKKDEGTTGTAPSASAPAPVATTTAAATDTASATTPPPPPPPPPVATAHESIDSCCASIASAEKSAKGAAQSALQRGAAVCPGLAANVKAGRSTRAAALAAVRASLTGAPTPAGCN